MARESILAGVASIGPTTMRRNGLFGGSAPSYSDRNPLSLADAILGRDPEPSNFLAGLAPPRPKSKAFLSGLYAAE